MLNLNQLRVLAAVARHGSVTGAARELHYSQPSVTDPCRATAASTRSWFRLSTDQLYL